jgi:hypothetical protein
MDTQIASDAALRRSFLRHLAALAATEIIDPHRLASALTDDASIDQELVRDLETLTHQLIAAVTRGSDRAGHLLLRGHLSILEHLIPIARPDLASGLRRQAERTAVVLAALDSVPG